MKWKKRFLCLLFGVGVPLVLAACGGDNDGITWCPAWEQGDSFSVTRSETVGGVAAPDTEATYVVTARGNGRVALSDGDTVTTYSLDADTYRPEFELNTYVYGEPYRVITYGDTDYASQTRCCPPPLLGDTFAYTSWVPGPIADTGDYYDSTLVVTDVVDEPVSVPASDYSARKVVLAKTSGGTTSVVSRYYVAGIGVVKEVEEIPATATVYSEEITALHTGAAPLGTAADPVVVTAGTRYEDFSLLSYVGAVGTGSLHVKLEGLLPTNNHLVELVAMSDDADLAVYGDPSFSNLLCSSEVMGTADEGCSADTTATGELYIRIDGSASTAGTEFALRANT